MKTVSNAHKFLSLSGTALALALFISAAPAMSAEPAKPADAPAAAPTLAVSATDAAPAAPMASPSASLPLPGANSPANRAKNLSALEEKVSDSVKNAVKQLSSIDNVNLDDLNTARQAVVKLEVLIDIEKHLAELDKIHNERNGGGEKALAAAIPASALGMPPSMELPSKSSSSSSASSSRNASSHMASFSAPSSSPVSGSSHLDVTRISGVDGNYKATIQGKVVSVGDSLADGSTVTMIASKQVTTKSKDGAVHQLKVKGVDEVFGRTL